MNERLNARLKARQETVARLRAWCTGEGDESLLHEISQVALLAMRDGKASGSAAQKLGSRLHDERFALVWEIERLIGCLEQADPDNVTEWRQ